MVLANRRLRPSLLGALLTLAAVAGGLRLGVWQLERADEKQALLSAFAAGAERVVVLDTPGGETELSGLPRYQAIEVTGRYDARQQVLLDNMPSARGQPGYHVLTALEQDNGEWLLVDRGWVAAGATREQLPDIAVGVGERTVRGRLDDLPAPGIRLAAPLAGSQQWPRVLNFPRHADLVAALGRQVADRILLLDPAQPDGYERIWQARFELGPERHLAYAVQWFALAAAMVITFLVVSMKKSAAPNE